MKDLLFKIYPRLFAKSYFRKWNFLLFRLGLSGMGVLNYHNFKQSGEYSFLKKVIKNYKITTIFDVGANEGKYSKTAVKLGFQGDIFCFEPHPVTFKSLKKNLKSLPVHLFNFGFSNRTQTAKIYDYGQPEGSSKASLFEEILQKKSQKVVAHEVTIHTIDDFLEGNEIKIGLLKVDTEGNEFNILSGAKKALNDKRIDIIQFEFDNMNIVSRVFLKDFCELLFNFNLYRLLPNSLLKFDYDPLTSEIFAFQNIVAIRKDFDKESRK